MFERDYLMRIFMQFAEALTRSWFMAKEKRDPRAAADMLEEAVGEATSIDGATLLSLTPESIAGILQVSGTDPGVAEYVARSLMLASGYLRDAGEGEVADLRRDQARALAEAYGLDLPDDPAVLAGVLEGEAAASPGTANSLDAAASPTAATPGAAAPTAASPTAATPGAADPLDKTDSPAACPSGGADLPTAAAPAAGSQGAAGALDAAEEEGPSADKAP